MALVRFALQQTDVLEPFPLSVEQRFQVWLASQESAGKHFTPEQLEWLQRIKGQIATSLQIQIDDFEYAPFFEMGGPLRVHQLFRADLTHILDELNEVLVR